MKRIFTVSAIMLIALVAAFQVLPKIIRHYRYLHINFKLDQCIGKKYTTEQLSFFSIVGFYNKKKTTKRIEDITISLEKGFQEEDIYTIDTIIQELAPLIKPLRISRVIKGGNVKFFFVNKSKGKLLPMAHGTTHTETKAFTREISFSEIYISTFEESYSRQSTMRHEMLHALGFSDIRFKGRLPGMFKSRLDWYRLRTRNRRKIRALDKKNYKFTDLDKAIIKILYDSCMPIGLKKVDFESQLNKTKQQ